MCIQTATIYKESRNQAGLTREVASERLHVSVESLGAYERAETRTPCEIVVKMAELYDDSALAYRHMTQYCPVGKTYLPPVEEGDEPMTVLRLMKETDDVADRKREMMDAVVLGVSRSAGVLKEVREMVGAGLGLLFSSKKRTVSAGNTHSSLRSKPV